MVDTFGLQNNDWVSIQYARKKNWASSYLMDKFCVGNNEMVAQFKTIYGEAVLTTGLTNLEHSAAEAYMKEIYGLVKKEIQAMVALELIKDRSISTTMIYKVYHNENRDRLYTVMYDRNDKNIECECKRWNSEGIPCRHMFCVMKREGYKEIPEKLILKR
ncbi:protein FAR1-RELATED SEQUENCE 4-like [Arachis stenosperma]|uniref:protein FAR1-RELATED SEQUENCE 4-like n=1 Tax=Arachis stenosperma TaxID=217475 RepID=UPI0025ABC122|nr:protein FAR1-RELATED SEQUENCE 4-like [Arachis stenosperma]